MTGRIVDVKAALETVTYGKNVNEKITFTVTDPIASWNNGTFTLNVQAGKGKVTLADGTDVAPTAAVPAGTLALLVFGTMNAKELRYYEKLTATDEEVQKLTHLFPKTECYINEWY